MHGAQKPVLRIELVPELGGHVLREMQRSVGAGKRVLFHAAHLAAAQFRQLAFNGLVQPDNLRAAVGNLGNVYACRQQWEKARACYEESLRIDYEIGNKLGIGIQAANTSMMENALGHFDKALEYCDKSIGAYRELSDLASAGQGLASRGAILLDAGRWAEALSTLREAVSAQHRPGYPGSRQELRDAANLIYAEFKCGDANAKARASTLLPRLENPPAKRDFTDEDMDRVVARMKEVLA
jgi:tetratricopeptide (TPR) repeat protein